MPTGNISTPLGRSFKKGLGVLAIGLISLLTWWYLEYREVAVLPEPLRIGKFVAVPIAPPQPALTELPYKPVREAGSELNPDELVLGAEVAGEARAYPINMLSGPSHEILNDILGGQPIAATW